MSGSAKRAEKFDSNEVSGNPAQPRTRLPTVAIVGRPNVGKSSLFNAILGRRLAIVHEASGVTRDRLMAPAAWRGRHFQLVDTGGIGLYARQKKSADAWEAVIRSQAEMAIEGADLLILVVNVQDGVAALDREVAGYLRACGKPVAVAVNKVDDVRHEEGLTDFAALGYEKIFPVSCLHRRGLDELLDDVLEDIQAPRIYEEAAEPFRIAVVGRPNVGKSSLVNALLGEERVIVSDIAGTTRDSIDIDFELKFHDEKIPAQLVDTAGLRKKAHLKDVVELFSVMRTQEAIKRSRLVLFLVEARKDGVTAQDRHIASLIEESGKSCLIVANKWDICEERNRKAVLDEIRYSLPGMSYAPVVFVSALKKDNLSGLLDHVATIMEQMEVEVPTSVVNKVIEDAVRRNAPQVVGLNPLRIYYGTMIGKEPPTFLLFVNKKANCADNYLAYLTNFFRNAFGFNGQPVRVELKERPKPVESFHTDSPAKTKSKFSREHSNAGGKVQSRKAKTERGKTGLAAKFRAMPGKGKGNDRKKRGGPKKNGQK